MLIINELQKIIYNQLIESKSENIKKLKNIASSSIINSDFPYLIIDINKIEIDKNFNNNCYIVSTKIKIFDKNESSINITNISDDVFKEILNLATSYIGCNRIIEVNLVNTEINMFNEINSVWNCNLNFNFVIENVI